MGIKKTVIIDDTENRRKDLEERLNQYNDIICIFKSIKDIKDKNDIDSFILHDSYIGKNENVLEFRNELKCKDILIVRFSGEADDKFVDSKELILSWFTLQTNIIAFLENKRNYPYAVPNCRILLYGEKYILSQLLELRKKLIIFYYNQIDNFDLKDNVNDILEYTLDNFRNLTKISDKRIILEEIKKLNSLIEEQL